MGLEPRKFQDAAPPEHTDAALPEILFVCTGNTCRSPLAAAVAAATLREMRLPYRAASAGIAADEGAPASQAAVVAAREAGLELAGHEARLLTRPMVLQAKLVLTLGESHRAFIQVLAPEARERVHVLRDYATRGGERHDVRDPIGGSVDQYRRTLQEIRELVRKSLQRLAEDAETRTP